MMKRMIAWGVNNGFDNVAWTTGRQQVERYEGGLRRVADEITWDASTRTTEKGQKRVRVKKSGEVTASFQIDERGIVVRGDGTWNDAEAIGKPLEDVVGKRMAQQILDDATGTIAEDGITIGGRGMEGFYDEILVKTANKLGKKHGAKVGQTSMRVDGEQSTPWISQTPSGPPSRPKASRCSNAKVNQGIRRFPRGWQGGHLWPEEPPISPRVPMSCLTLPVGVSSTARLTLSFAVVSPTRTS